jgi:integration host factor subunit alpha
MTKSDLAEHLYETVDGTTKQQAAEYIEAALDLIKQTLEQGDNVKIAGFGNFVLRDKNARLGRNPHTGAPMPLNARRVVTFKASQILRKEINSSGE